MTNNPFRAWVKTRNDLIGARKSTAELRDSLNQRSFRLNNCINQSGLDVPATLTVMFFQQRIEAAENAEALLTTHGDLANLVHKIDSLERLSAQLSESQTRLEREKAALEDYLDSLEEFALCRDKIELLREAVELGHRIISLGEIARAASKLHELDQEIFMLTQSDDELREHQKSALTELASIFAHHMGEQRSQSSRLAKNDLDATTEVLIGWNVQSLVRKNEEIRADVLVVHQRLEAEQNEIVKQREELAALEQRYREALEDNSFIHWGKAIQSELPTNTDLSLLEDLEALRGSLVAQLAVLKTAAQVFDQEDQERSLRSSIR